MLHETLDSLDGFPAIPADLLLKPSPGKHDRRWSIVLAGGRGERIGAFVHRWMGRTIPKQYCTFVGTRSMLQHTLDRALLVGRQDRQIVVIAKSHIANANYLLADRTLPTVLVQPANRDTFAGIFLPLTYAYARDSEATVVIYPSDHFIYPENAFVAWIAGAIDAAEEMPDRILLIGASADRPEPDYGWIAAGKELWRKDNHSVHAVDYFSEKPSPAKAIAYFASGWLWNTMIVVAKARILWQLGWKHFPETMKLFERLKDAVGTSRQEAVLDAIYELMPARNFSSDFLAQANGRVAVIPMKGILWSDWGRAERIAETLHCIGKRPNFPETILAA
jgi:mannose-1-phosphate guanylyltransferase